MKKTIIFIFPILALLTGCEFNDVCQFMIDNTSATTQSQCDLVQTFMGFLAQQK